MSEIILDFITFDGFLSDKSTPQRYYEVSRNYEEEVEGLSELWDQMYELVTTADSLTREQEEWVGNVVQSCVYYTHAMRHNLKMYPKLVELENLKGQLEYAKRMREDRYTIDLIKSKITVEEKDAKRLFKLSVELFELEMKKIYNSGVYSSENHDFFKLSFIFLTSLTVCLDFTVSISF